MRHSKLALDPFDEGYMDDETHVDVDDCQTLEWERPQVNEVCMEAGEPTLVCWVPPIPGKGGI